MKLLILGDVHGDWSSVEAIVEKEQPHTVLCVGDLQTYKDIGRSVYFVKGNHEDFDVIEALGDEEDPRRIENLYPIGPTHAISLDAHDVWVAGLGGNYSPTRSRLPKEKLTGDRRRHFCMDDVEACGWHKHVDIFLSHEAPVALGVMRGNKNLGIPIIDDLITKLHPRYAFSGHHHQYREGKLGTTILIGLDMPCRSYVVLETEGFTINRHLTGQDNAAASSAR